MAEPQGCGGFPHPGDTPSKAIAPSQTGPAGMEGLGMRKGPEDRRPASPGPDQAESRERDISWTGASPGHPLPKTPGGGKGSLQNRGSVSPTTPTAQGENWTESIPWRPLPSGLTTRGHNQMEKIVKRVAHLHIFACVCISTQEHAVHSQAVFK